MLTSQLFPISATYSWSSSECVTLPGQWILKKIVIGPNKLEWESNLLWTFPARHNLSPSLAVKQCGSLNWVPDRWFQCFQDYISNHFAHIAKLALKKGKELFCCIDVPSELFAVKGMKKWRKSREWCLKNMQLELGNVSDILMIPRSHHNLPLMVNLQDTLKATVRTQTFSYRGLRATSMLSTMWEVRTGCGFSLTSCHLQPADQYHHRGWEHGTCEALWLSSKERPETSALSLQEPWTDGLQHAKSSFSFAASADWLLHLTCCSFLFVAV